MKFEKIIALIEKAGFTFRSQSQGVDEFEGYKVSHFEKDMINNSQYIQLALEKEDIIKASFSLNVPVKLRDEVYAIMNDPIPTIEYRLGM